MIDITIPSRALVLTVGPAGCGKSTFVTERFQPTQIVSSDVCRAMVTDDETNQEHNKAAFDLFHAWIGHRLAAGRLTVADATNLLPSARAKLRDIAATHRVPVIVLEFDVSEETCLFRNAQRERFVPEHVIRKHAVLSAQAEVELRNEGYQNVYVIREGREDDYFVTVLAGCREIDGTAFDIIGDIHGCADELEQLIAMLGYELGTTFEGEGFTYLHPQGRKLVFLGDITDRGPDSLRALRIVKLALEGGHHCVMGNHDNKLMRALRGNKVQMGHGLAQTFRQLDEEAEPSEKTTLYQMLSDLPFQLRLKVRGRRDVIVCHAGLPLRLVGKDNSEARNHAIYGETDGTNDERGFPTRGLTYLGDYPLHRGGPVLVHGHTVVENPVIRSDRAVFNLDTGCVFGGALTALQWPEGKLVQVPALQQYSVR